MKKWFLVLLMILSCFTATACGEGKGNGELCASNADCESDLCGFGPCPDSGPPCPEGEECECLVCL